MTDKLSIETNEAIVDVLPRLGGSLAAFDLKTGATRTQILRRWTGEIEDPRYYASSPMVPWFNRISGGGFSFGGTFYPIAPNFRTTRCRSTATAGCRPGRWSSTRRPASCCV